MKPDFRSQEVQVFRAMESIARWRAAHAPSSGWLLEAPAESVEADNFTGKIGTRGRPLTDIEREEALETGRKNDLRLLSLRGRTGMVALEWLVSCGGSVTSLERIEPALGRALASSRQRAVWAGEGDLGKVLEGRWGAALWREAVTLWVSG